MGRLGARGKINPPLRKKDDSQRLWQLLADGQIDLATSDHAPWQPDRKNKADIFDNASGAPGVETLLPLLYSEGVAAGRLSLRRLVQVLCEAPADRFGLSPRKGRLSVGSDADIVVLDPEKQWIIDPAKLLSSAGWTPYEGVAVRGRITHVFLRGRSIFEEGIVIGKAGDGEFLSPKL